jgi:hypothetical protein
MELINQLMWAGYNWTSVDSSEGLLCYKDFASLEPNTIKLIVWLSV